MSSTFRKIKVQFSEFSSSDSKKKEELIVNGKAPQQAPQQPPWRNVAYDVYKKECGEEGFEEKLKEFRKPPPPPGRLSSFNLYHVQIPSIKTKISAHTFFVLGKRSSHPMGVGGLGYATIHRNPTIPQNAFFIPGKRFLVRVRHSNTRSDDDAETDARGMTIKFADSDEESPLDILAGTGVADAIWNLQSIYQDGEEGKHLDDPKKLKECLLRSPDYLHCKMEIFRRGPQSYTDLRYHTQAPVEFIAVDKVKRYAKFRVVPADGRSESGRLSEEEQNKLWDVMKRAKDDTRPKNYLREEFKSLVQKGPVRYTLQIQLHLAKKDDPWDIFHPGIPWDETSHPWIDLADVTVTSLLPDDITEGMKFNVGRLPSGTLALLPAESSEDFRCVNQIRQAAYSASQSARRNSVPKGAQTTYTVTVETGAQLGSGTNSCINIVLYGSKLITDEVALGSWFRNDYRKGQLDTYNIKTYDVGELHMVKLVNKGWLLGNDDWFVTVVTVTDAEGKKYVFPCRRWIVDEIALFGGGATHPHTEQPGIFQASRSMEIQKRQEEYKWGTNKAPFDGLPGYIAAENHNEIPRDSRFTDEASKSFIKSIVSMTAATGLAQLSHEVNPWDTMEEFEMIFHGVADKVNLPDKINADNWKDDLIFGQQFMNGVNPLMLERCDNLPADMKLPDKVVDDLLDRGRSLYREMKDGHVYKVDYKILEGIPRYKEGTWNPEERFCAEPIALFYTNKAGGLIPIAIQLRQTGEDNPVWTPHDPPLEWLYAKMWLQNANLQVHQMLSHLLQTHLMMEPFAVATWRMLPSTHPVFRLLFPHIRSIMAINTIGRQELVGEGGLADQTLSIGGGGHIKLMQKLYKTFTWDMYDIPALLKRKGVDDATKLPGFYYRDDALSLWNAMKNFIREFISQFYKTEKDVAQDEELQAWVKEIHRHGYPSFNAREDHKFPNMLRTRYQLVHLLTCVMFHCSCQHAAVNFGQLEMYAYMPNTPSCMHLPPPSAKGLVEEHTFIKAYPNKAETVAYLGLMRTLTQYADDETYIGDYSDGLFANPHVHVIVERYQAELRRISESIKQRNEKTEWPYTYLLPERVPNSIAI